MAGAGQHINTSDDVRVTSRRSLIKAAGVLGACCASGLTRSHAAPVARELSFGLTPVFLSSDLDLIDALRAYLAKATGRAVRLVSRRTYQEVTAMLLSGEIDAAWICGYPFVAHRAALDLLAVPVWRGMPLYQAYVIVPADRRGAVGLMDLAGDVHAFSDPDSNSGYLVTAAALAAKRLRPQDFFAKSFFTYSHRNVIRAVASGLADSGSVDGYVWEVMTETDPGLTAQTRVVRRSDWLGFPPVAAPSARAGAPEPEALRAALLGMADDPVGRAVLGMLRLDGFGRGEPSLFDAIAAEAAVLQGLG